MAMRMIPRGSSLAVALLAVLGCGSQPDERPVSWSYIVRAILRPNCATSNCHSERAAAGDLELVDPDVAHHILVEDEKHVMPQNVAGSSLIKILRGTEEQLRMPPDQPLPEADIELIERWIEAGAEND
jgi:hypothetical protein